MPAREALQNATVVPLRKRTPFLAIESMCGVGSRRSLTTQLTVPEVIGQ